MVAEWLFDLKAHGQQNVPWIFWPCWKCLKNSWILAYELCLIWETLHWSFWPWLALQFWEITYAKKQQFSKQHLLLIFCWTKKQKECYYFVEQQTRRLFTMKTWVLHPELSSKILEKNMRTSKKHSCKERCLFGCRCSQQPWWNLMCICSNNDKLINSENIFYKLLFPYSLWLITVVIIVKPHNWNENDKIWTKMKKMNGCEIFAWKSQSFTREVWTPETLLMWCLSRCMEAVDRRKVRVW